MSEKVSTFVEVGRGPHRYAFILVVWNDYADRVREELNRQADAFGADLGPQGVFVQAFPARAYETAEQVLGKAWPDEISARMADDQDPIILVIADAFESFDPREHAYAVIWLSDFDGNPEAVRPLLQKLAMKTRRGEDVISYLQDVAERAQRDAEIQAAGREARGVARLASYVEIKPRLFGVSIDLKTLLRDIAGAP
jgi:hypothetical protein